MASTQEEDALWEAVVALLLESGSAMNERRSRYGEKSAVYEQGREIAHLEAPGQIDLRITRAAWRQLRDRYADDSAVQSDPRRRDWVTLVLTSAADVERLRDLLEAAAHANH